MALPLEFDREQQKLVQPQLTIQASEKETSQPAEPLFNNPFKIEDLAVFDQATMRELVHKEAFGLTVQDLAVSVRGADGELVEHIRRSLPLRQRHSFVRATQRPVSMEEIKGTRQRLLDGLFWELTYWKTPELYEELTEGERLHPGIFKQLRPALQGKTVLDAGAGSGRAAFEALRAGARQVYAVEPSPGLLKILERKVADQPDSERLEALKGRFDSLPLEDNSVDVALSCSAFTAEAEQGGEPGLAELKRVTRPGGKIIIIWPRSEDRDWLKERGFRHVALSMQQEMKVHFRSLRSAVRCAQRFYGRNRAVLQYLLRWQRPEVPFSVLGFNPPHDYCWLEAK